MPKDPTELYWFSPFWFLFSRQRLLSLKELAHSEAWTAVPVRLEAQAAFWVP